MAGRPLGSLSVNGKQSEEERKIKKRSYKRTPEALQRAVIAKKLKRLETRQEKAEELLERKREELTNLGIVGIPADGNEKGLMKILRSPQATKLEFLSNTTGLVFEEDSPTDRINRLVQHAYSMQMTHKAEGRFPKTLPKRFQDEFRQVALTAEQVSENALERFFNRLIREKKFSVKNISRSQDASMRSQLSGGSLETMRSMEDNTKHGRGILPSRSAIQKFNYEVECGAKKKYVESKETPDGSIFRITVSCILVEMLGNNRKLIQKFGCTEEQISNQDFKPNVIKLLMVVPSLVIRVS